MTPYAGPSWNCRQLDHRLREIGCEHLRTSGSHRHYANPFRPDRLVTFAWHPGDGPRGIIAGVIEDPGISRDDFYFNRFGSAAAADPTQGVDAPSSKPHPAQAAGNRAF